MNNQEFLYKIATDQRFADTLRLAIQIQRQLPMQLQKQAAMSNGVRNAIAGGKERQDNNNKKKETSGEERGGRRGERRKAPPAKQETKTEAPAKDTKPEPTNKLPGYDAGKAVGYGQAASSAVQGGLGALLGRYGIGGISEQLGRLAAYIRNAGGRAAIRNIGRSYNVPTANATGGYSMGTYRASLQGPGHGAASPLTAADITNGMNAVRSDLMGRFGRVGRTVGTYGGAAGGIALSMLTNNWLSNLIKDKMGGAA